MKNWILTILFILSFQIIFSQNNLTFDNDQINKNVIDSMLVNVESEIQHNLLSAELMLNKLIILSDSLGYEKGKILSYCNLAFLNYIKNNVSNSRNYAMRALSHAKRIRFSTGIAKAQNTLGLIEWRKGSYSTAIDHYLEALQYADTNIDKTEIAKSYNYLGLIFWKTGNYPKSISYLYKALNLKEELNDPNEIAITLNNLSTVFIQVGNFNESIKYAQRALSIAKEIDVKYSIGRALGNLGVSYLRKGDENEALNYLNEAINIKRISKEQKGLAYSLLDIGDIYFTQNEFDLAQSKYSEALGIMADIHDSHGLSIAYTNLAKIAVRKNKFTTAIDHLKNSDKYAESENLKECLKNNKLLFSDIYEKWGNTKKAFEYFKEYSSLKDTILNSRSRSEINELKVNYETDRKEKENRLLKTENQLKTLELSYNNSLLIFSIILGVLFFITALLYYFRFKNKNKVNEILLEKNKQIESHRQELSDLNNTKDKFFSIIAHDLRNPFVSLINSSSLLLSDFDNLSDKDKIVLIESLNNSAKTNLSLLENLLTWAKSQRGGIEYKPGLFNISNRISANMNLFSDLAEQKQIELKYDSRQSIYIYADEYMIDTILRNLIGNAVKFTPIKGKVEITSVLNSDELKISIKDNGRGISISDIENIFEIDNKVSTPGTAGEPGSGLGLIIAKEFIDQNNGKIGVYSKEGEGSEFWFTLPVSSN